MFFSKMFSLKGGDVARGAVTAAFAGSFVVVGSVVLQSGFDVFTADWEAIGKMSINAGIASFFGYIMKNFFTDESGKMFGVL
jgi:hypothetical protein